MVNFDVEQDNAHFRRILGRMYGGFIVFGYIYLIISTYAILKSKPLYMHDWRGATCIVLTILIPASYVVPRLIIRKWVWSPPVYYKVTLWSILYLTVLLFTLIDRDFIWDFYLVFGFSFGLFEGRRLLLVISVIALTMFALQGLLVWPLSGDTLFSLAGQGMNFFSITNFCMLLQYLVAERFKRNELFGQLRQANSELEETHRRLEQSVEQEQELAVLRERTRLAREMHDTLGHALVLIAVKLEAAQRLRERDPERCDRELESTKEIARESMAALRASIANLRSPTLEREHIQQALARSARALAQRTGLHVNYTVQVDIECLPEAIEETLWKVSQEALANIEKHAHAQHVDLRISRQEGQLIMTIQDDGAGLPEAHYQYHKDGSLLHNCPAGHYGLRGMLERVENVGGRLSLHSSKGQGTTVEIALPLAGARDILV